MCEASTGASREGWTARGFTPMVRQQYWRTRPTDPDRQTPTDGTDRQTRSCSRAESEARRMATPDTATTDTEDPTLTVDELAARAGVTVRTVRFYGTRGLLPPPVLGPRRVGHYGPEHLSRLALIEELQHHGMTLSAIERYLRQLPPDL